MLQNRVQPNGAIIKTAARGAWMGNRGLMHNDRKELIKAFNLKAWITCRLAYKGWKRQVMAPGKYTELFFMDEATAFAAGHRPCALCRREDYNHFKECWINGNPELGLTLKTPMAEIDALIHTERIGKQKQKITYKEQLCNLSDGTFITKDNAFYLVWKGKLYNWTPSGYDKPEPIKPSLEVIVLTPQSMVNALKAGYRPQVNL